MGNILSRQGGKTTAIQENTDTTFDSTTSTSLVIGSVTLTTPVKTGHAVAFWSVMGRNDTQGAFVYVTLADDGSDLGNMMGAESDPALNESCISGSTEVPLDGSVIAMYYKASAGTAGLRGLASSKVTQLVILEIYD